MPHTGTAYLQRSRSADRFSSRKHRSGSRDAVGVASAIEKRHRVGELEQRVLGHFAAVRHVAYEERTVVQMI